MNAENTTYLINTYPMLYLGHQSPLTENLMCFGFDCGDGWFNIIDDLSKKIEAYNVANAEYDPCIAAQVKEKYGTLRFYVNSVTDEIYEWIEQAEIASEKTCEICGKPGELVTKGWYMVRCPEHLQGPRD
jgi:hypothetical protein